MKKALYIIFVLFSLKASAQAVDSSKLYSYAVPIQSRSLDQLYELFRSGEAYEDVYDLVKAKYTPKAAAPSGTTIVTLDSVRNDALVGIYAYVINLQSGFTGAWSNSVKTALKTAPVSTWVIAQCNTIDGNFNTISANRGNEGRRLYTRQRN